MSRVKIKGGWPIVPRRPECVVLKAEWAAPTGKVILIKRKG